MNITVNGVLVEVEGSPSPELAAVRELLRQRAVASGLLDSAADGESDIDTAIERLLADEVQVPTAGEAECLRHYETHREDYSSGDLVQARHILFQVTASVRVPEIRARAEETLVAVLDAPERFASLARELSNCPSGQQDGHLGQIGRGDTVPEFERALFDSGTTGTLRELVRTRYGFHIVAVDRRIAGERLPYDVVRERIAARLEAEVETRALRQYVAVLAGQAEIDGVDLEAAPTPLVQ